MELANTFASLVFWINILVPKVGDKGYSPILPSSLLPPPPTNKEAFGGGGVDIRTN